MNSESCYHCGRETNNEGLFHSLFICDLLLFSGVPSESLTESIRR